jgi:two-component system sensor histidine kinase KdpD
MLDEGGRRAERGARVVIGWVDTHDRAGTNAQLGGLERAPTTMVDGQPDIDVAAVLARHPDVCLVDELGTGPAGAPRWRSVEQLLDAGVDVVSTLRVEHLASLQDVIDDLLGPAPRPTVPDEVVRRAEQIELVDMTPEAIRRRLAHGNIVGPDALDAATADSFRPDVLASLRQLAMLWVADQLEDTLVHHRAGPGRGPAETRERVAVSVTGAPAGDRVIRRAARLAGRLGGDLVGIHVRPADGHDDPLVAARRSLLEDLGGRYIEVVSGDVAAALLGVARSEAATQLVVGATGRSWWSALRAGSVVNDVLRGAGDLDVHVTASAEAAPQLADAANPFHPSSLPRRRRVWGWASAIVLPPVLAAALEPARLDLELATVLLAFLATAVLSAAVGGTGPGLLAAAVGFGLANWFFTEPVGSWTIADPEHVIALSLSLLVAAAAGTFVSAAARRATEAAQARSEAVALARAAATTVAPDPLESLVELVRAEVRAVAVAVLTRSGPAWVLEAAAGSPVPEEPTGPEGRGVTLPVGDEAVLVVDAAHLTPTDVGLLTALASQLTSALSQRRLASEAAGASALAAANDLRGAILNAASHDLRSPLAGIKAAVSSLLAKDVTWDPASQADFLTTIDAETDRLTNVVTNLLDLSRLQAEAVRPELEPVGAGEIVASALASLGLHGDADVQVDVDEALPDVLGDPGLLERVVANLVQNAQRHAADSHRPVRIQASVVGGRLLLRIVDRGPGVPRAERDRLFQPFEQAGEAGGPGLGLGLAVSRGFVAAHGGDLSMEDTPGGGCTMVVSLPLAPQ